MQSVPIPNTSAVEFVTILGSVLFVLIGAFQYILRYQKKTDEDRDEYHDKYVHMQEKYNNLLLDYRAMRYQCRVSQEKLDKTKKRLAKASIVIKALYGRWKDCEEQIDKSEKM